MKKFQNRRPAFSKPQYKHFAIEYCLIPERIRCLLKPQENPLNLSDEENIP